jgi:hypothetical protein
MINWIFNLFVGSPASLIFFGVFLFGFAITLTSLAFGVGDDHDGDFHVDHDVGHDFGDDHHGPGIFSIRGMSLLAIGFGGVGYLIQLYTGKLLFSSVAGLGSGFGFAFLGLWLIRFFYSQEGSSLIKEDDILRSVGSVTTTIPSGGVGEVILSVAGRQLSQIASSHNGNQIARGKIVTVINRAGNRVVVEEVGE